MVKTFAITFSVILVLLGLFGFISNPLIGANALFETNSATNWLHLFLGVFIYLSTFA
ncbi:MAG: hypothetical protein PHD04_01700 [Candidatus Pacebacteria bacterium]|nr:hypothetical protein [Candidatus Paceibacterota bacterium]